MSQSGTTSSAEDSGKSWATGTRPFFFCFLVLVSRKEEGFKDGVDGKLIGKDREKRECSNSRMIQDEEVEEWREENEGKEREQ